MNLEDYRAVWQGEGTGNPLRSEMERLTRELGRSERRERMVLYVCALNTVLALLLTSGVVLFRRPLAWDEVLPAATVQLVLALGLIWLIRRHRERRRRIALNTSTVTEAARLNLEDVNSQLRSVRILLGIACVVVPLLALSVSRLVTSGKMNAQAAWNFALLCTAVIGVNVAIQWWRHRSTLIPRRRRLQEILTSLDV